MLRSERVTLRALQREDVPVMCSFSNDPEILALSGAGPAFPRSLATAYARFDSSAGSDDRSQLLLGIEADERLIGSIAMHHFNDLARTAMLGIAIGAKEYFGRGYGREAIGLVLKWGFEQRNLNRIYLNVAADNPRAIRCYLACGFVEEGRLRQHVWSNGSYVDEVQMGILKSEWLER